MINGGEEIEQAKVFLGGRSIDGSTIVLTFVLTEMLKYKIQQI